MANNEYYTPKYIFDKLGATFDLDVASPIDRTHCHVPAAEFITENSLEMEWSGFIWMNPPYDHQKGKMQWLEKFFDHGNGIALMPDRTSAPWWQYAANRAYSHMQVNGKIKFITPNGKTADQPGNGTTLFAAGLKAGSHLLLAQDIGLGTVFIKQ